KPRVEGLDEVEEMPDCGRKVEVVSEGTVPALENLGGRFRIDSDWAEADSELIQPLDCAVRRLEELGRKRQGAAVVGAGHQRIADRAGLIALGQQVAQRR